MLLAEDDLVNQQVAKLHLESYGLKVHVVPHGAAAVEAVMAGRYDAVFMDLHMPRMDGLEATRTIRKRELNGARTPIVAWTASVTSEDRERCMQAGSDAVLTKPFDREELERMLLKFFTRSSASPQIQPGACSRAGICAERLDH